MQEYDLADHNPVSKHAQQRGRPPFERIALLLQGGGALGAYQAGVYQGLAEAGLHPDWTAGISIGAINAALIAGNRPEDRVAKLRQFWELVTSTDPHWQFPNALAQFDPSRGDVVRALSNQWSAAQALCLGAAGFFVPRLPAPWLWPHGTTEATSYYDTRQLKATLERLVDFDRINGGAMRFSVGAVDVRTGNLVYFDSTTQTIRPEHVMASGALPPGFPAVEIDGEHYWDGGLVSNTPLSWVVDSLPHRDTLAFQVDLWSARGELPRKMAQIQMRQKDIQYSSRTRAELSRFREIQSLRGALSRLIGKLPAELAAAPEVDILRPATEPKAWNLVQLGYRPKRYEDDTKDYEFSRRSMEDHWQAGHHDTIRTLRHPEVLELPRNPDGVFTFDIAEQGRG
ncbi:NTE family protein [Mesorhizobium albiziae]|uniref:NTE family protein n=1 Tax=Neomesorhizobium albiziae TaxID=335020 RepID=A0A1I4FVN7_9HYPH|nr:patatin-like phospholipase family protein [Mesorhizobium albiziae]GLS34132.1 membrane protein [Mesorhizobium albiziae]SFL21948.1 NTE family protein [Mesorhizobium albiziae]